ncbi:MAG: hypothetical protein PHE15_07065, partial [Dehalococcoidales bacterium]|nr:hypothetical protein [Dehalococcoidales bacterium]
MEFIKEFLQQTLIYQIMLVIIFIMGLWIGYLCVKLTNERFKIKRMEDILKYYEVFLLNSQFNDRQINPNIN